MRAGLGLRNGAGDEVSRGVLHRRLDGLRSRCSTNTKSFRLDLPIAAPGLAWVRPRSTRIAARRGRKFHWSASPRPGTSHARLAKPQSARQNHNGSGVSASRDLSSGQV
jgi:hypothetical protein